jgi:hypothetical protein
MDMLITRLLIAAALAVVVIALLIVYRGRIQTAWRGHLAGVVHSMTVVGVILVVNALARMYIF